MAINQLVIFKIGVEEFAIDVSNISSINGYSPISFTPDSIDYVEGVINLRGDVIPVINLAKRLNITTEVLLKEKRIIVAEIEKKAIGFLVDDASKAVAVEDENIEETPAIVKGNDGNYIKGVCKLEDSIILLIDLEKILDHDSIVKIKNIKA